MPPNEEHSTTYSLDKSINSQPGHISISFCQFVENIGEMCGRAPWTISRLWKTYMSNSPDLSIYHLQVKIRDVRETCRLKET